MTLSGNNVSFLCFICQGLSHGLPLLKRSRSLILAASTSPFYLNILLLSDQPKKYYPAVPVNRYKNKQKALPEVTGT